jgi:hypothetical protein
MRPCATSGFHADMRYAQWADPAHLFLKPPMLRLCALAMGCGAGSRLRIRDADCPHLPHGIRRDQSCALTCGTRRPRQVALAWMRCPCAVAAAARHAGMRCPHRGIAGCKGRNIHGDMSRCPCWLRCAGTPWNRCARGQGAWTASSPSARQWHGRTFGCKEYPCSPLPYGMLRHLGVLAWVLGTLGSAPWRI